MKSAPSEVMAILPEPIIYEYCIIRCVPDVERGEFINVGLLMMCKRYKWLKGECILDMPEVAERLSACSASIDKNFARQVFSLFSRVDVPDPSLPVEEKYRWLAAVKSALAQTSPSHPGVISPKEGINVHELLETKFNELLQRLVL